MTFLAARLAEIRKYLEHLRQLRDRVKDADDLLRDLSLRNDVLFSLVMIAQLVADVSGELSSRRGLTFGSYREAVENLAKVEGFPGELAKSLAGLPGFRNVVLHEYVDLDYDRVLKTLSNLAPIEEFIEIVAEIEMDG